MGNMVGSAVSSRAGNGRDTQTGDFFLSDTQKLDFSDTEQQILERLETEPRSHDMFWDALRLSDAYVSGWSQKPEIRSSPELGFTPAQDELFKRFAQIAIRDHRYRDAAAKRLGIPSNQVRQRQATFC
jgi:hypothetical protein